jgi:hypothetical protein
MSSCETLAVSVLTGTMNIFSVPMLQRTALSPVSTEDSLQEDGQREREGDSFLALTRRMATPLTCYALAYCA